MTASQSLASDFAFQFEGVDPSFGDHGRVDVRCNRPGETNVGCGGGDATPFLMEFFNHEGINYYHMLVGLPESGFSQEVYIQAGGEAYSESVTGSSSLGDGNCRSGISFTLTACSAGDPLGFSNDNNFTGNGSGDPRKVEMHQVMGGTWNSTTKTWSCEAGDNLCYSFLKNAELNKPQIALTLRDSALFFETQFGIDMSNSNYATSSVAGDVTGTTTVSDPDFGLQAGAGNFDHAIDSESTSISAGRYIFTATSATAASLNPYTYENGGNFQLDQDWTIYYDPAQN